MSNRRPVRSTAGRPNYREREHSDSSSGEDFATPERSINPEPNLFSPSTPTNDPGNLLVPDPPAVDEVLAGVANALLPLQIDGIDDQSIASLDLTVNEQQNQVEIMTNYDQENGVDNNDALAKACQLLNRYAWQPDKLNFYFNQIEIHMKASGVKKQFTKLQVLAIILPKEVLDEVTPLLSKQESEFPNNDSYYQLKTEILRIFGPPKEAEFERAMGRVMSGKPSQLARALVNDLCSKGLDGCCCNKFIFGLWRRSLPTAVRQAIATKQFNKDTFNAILQEADDVFASTAPPSMTVAGISAAVQPGQPSQPHVVAVQPPVVPSSGVQGQVQPGADWSGPAHPPDSEVAAVYYQGHNGVVRGPYRGGRGSGRGFRGGGRGGFRGGAGRGNRGGGNGGGSQAGPYNAANPRWPGKTRHPDLPPWGACKKHFVWGKSAHWCEEPHSCAWKQFTTPKNQN